MVAFPVGFPSSPEQNGTNWKQHTPQKSQMFILFLSLFGVPNSIFRFPVQPPVWLDPCFCCVFEGALFHLGLYKEKPKGRSPYMCFCVVFFFFLGCQVFNKNPNKKVSHRRLVGPPLEPNPYVLLCLKIGEPPKRLLLSSFLHPKKATLHKKQTTPYMCWTRSVRGLGKYTTSDGVTRAGEWADGSRVKWTAVEGERAQNPV